MKRWSLEYWSSGAGKGPVEKWLEKLTEEQFEAIYGEMRLLSEIGNELRLPHSKALSQGLFELRERTYGFRIYYGFKKKQIIILLAAGNKTSQAKDIKIARERLLQCE